ncbi:MAG: hypothetical protein WCK27_32985 [Verrucomicrobiota bacterium]
MVKTLSNVTMPGGETIDGVDLSAHAADITTRHLPAQAGMAGKVLQSDGSAASWQTPGGASDPPVDAVKYAIFRGGL